MTGRRIVVLDTCVLFRLDNVGRLDLLRGLDGFEFVFPDEVWAEVKEQGQRRRILCAVRNRWLRRQCLDLGQEQVRKSQALDAGLDEGEAASLALAGARGFLLGTDDKAAMKEAERVLGPGRTVTTPGLVVEAIRQGRLEVDTADTFLQVWEGRRFKVSIRSFRDCL